MDTNGTDYRNLFDRVIAETLAQAVRIIAADPALIIAGAVILHHQQSGAECRLQRLFDPLLTCHVQISPFNHPPRPHIKPQ